VVGNQVGNWRDLLNDEPFKRKDLIKIQDPTDLEKHNLTKFHHLKHNLKVSNLPPSLLCYHTTTRARHRACLPVTTMHECNGI
jgi:hypothetical protein